LALQKSSEILAGSKNLVENGFVRGFAVGDDRLETLGELRTVGMWIFHEMK
jgi:hypothetical protein